jgi:Carbohydrate-selective porin, OprB family/S-layer homology domain
MKKLWQFLIASPAVVGSMLIGSGIVLAGEAPTTNIDSQVPVTPVDNLVQQNSMPQVTSVSQLSDVQPTDWAFQALQSLVERYGCIAGYPNGTFRGNRAMTRYEFAAGLNACLNRVNELIATATGDLVKKEDLEALRKLQEQFASELATLRGRVDAVEAKAAELEANQFSTTTKLQGQVVGVVSDVFSGNNVNGVSAKDNNTTLGVRARIELVTSFTGRDTLFTRIQANNIVTPSIGTPEGSLFFAASDDPAEATMDAVIDALWYSFPVSENTEVKLIANAGAADDVTNTVNIFDGDGAFGAFSTFGTRNPIYYQMSGAGLALNHKFGDALTLSLGYLAGDGFNSAGITNPGVNNPNPKSGLFGGSYGALAQLTVKPSDRFTVGLTYINSYNQELGAGSTFANYQSYLSSLGEDVPFSSNSYGLQASLGLSEKFVLGGWLGYTTARNLTNGTGTITRGEVDLWNWAVTLGFPDLGKKGNLAGIIVGMEPRVTSSSIRDSFSNTVSIVPKDRDTSYHIEAFYQYKVSDNITITPGVIWLTAPDHDNRNDDVVIGALRTTFSF